MFRDIDGGFLMSDTTDPAGTGDQLEPSTGLGTGGDDGPLDTSRGHADPAGFDDGDGIDSAAVDEPADGYRQPAAPDAEPPADPSAEPV
jgi:hypothetical protein